MKENNRIEELKEIALELLRKYQESERMVIHEYSGNISGEEKELEVEIQEYKEKIMNI